MKSLRLKKALRAALFVLLLSVVGMTKMYAYSFSAVCETGQTLYYNITNATNHCVALTCPGYNGWYGYTKPTGDMILPENVQYDGVTYSVTSIGSYAFEYCSGLTTIEIPNSVTSIGSYAFEYCSGLTTIEIPNSVTSIGDYTFYDCSGLTTIEIPNSVTSIGSSAFYDCSGLTTIEIPNSVTSIGSSAFKHCSGLTTIMIPNSVNSIGSSAFEYCSGLSSLTVLAETPPILGSDYVFYDVNAGIPVYVPCGSVEAYMEANWGGFSNFIGFCGGTVTVAANPEEGGTVTGGGTFGADEACTVIATANEGYAFANWTRDGRIVSNKAEYTFYVSGEMDLVAHFVSNANITFVDANVKALCVANWDTNGDGELSYAEAAAVTSLGNVFQYNTSITSFDELQYFIGLISIGREAFSFCRSLTTIEIPNSVILIEDRAFESCQNLTTIEIPNSVILIGSYAFAYCYNLFSVEIPNSVTLIGGSAFYDCSLTTIEIPNSVTSIGGMAFSGCWLLEQIIVDSGNAVYDSRDNCNAIIVTSTNELVAGCKNTVIPNSVTSIGYGAFYDCYDLITIEIPNSVTSIGMEAFRDCRSLTSIEISNSVTSIDGYAFYNCIGLTTIEIPNSVTSVGNFAFSGCSGLQQIIVDSGNTVYDSRDNCNAIIETSTNELVVGCKNTVIPNSITSIRRDAFSGCSGLSSLTVLAETPPTLGDNYVFSNVNKGIPVYVLCGSVEAYTTANWGGFSNFIGICGGTVTVAANPEEGGIVIGGGTFGADETCTVTATANEGYTFTIWTRDGIVVSTDAEYTFYVTDDMNLVAHFGPNANITFADANVKALCVANWDTNGDGELSYVEAAEVTSLGWRFNYNSSITSFDELQYFIGLASIGSSAFSGCSGLTTIELPNSVISIGSSAFSGCSGLTTIELPNSVISIEDRAFSYCSGLTSIEIPNSVTSIGSAVFSGCHGLEQIVVTSGNTIYDSRDNCNAIIITSTNKMIAGCKNTVIPNTVTSIGSSVFSGCSGLTSIEIPNSITSIGESAFYSCSGLTTIELPNSVTSIGYCAFYGCSGLTTIEIPNSVTSIHNSAFNGCNGLEQIIVTSGNTVYDSRENCNAIINSITSELVAGCKNTVIPNSVTSIGEYAFYSCSGLTTIEIPNSVTFIGYNTFYNCSGLTSMTILADNPPTLGSSSVFSDVNKSIPVNVPCGSLEAYQNAAGWNEFTNIQEVCTQTQTLNLSKGWNWWSSYIELSDIDGLSLLENAIGIPNVRIESKDGDYVRSKVRNGRTVWVGALTSINNEEMYKINTKETCTATIEGQVANPANHPITINRGWNWIGFPCDHSVSVSEAMSGFSPKKNDMIKGRNGSATYSNGTWSGTLNTLEPGKGYMYGSKSNATKTLVFQTGNRGEATLVNITPENNYYQPVEDYADNMTLIAVVELDGGELRSDGYEVAAFVGDECRGSVKLMYVEPIDRYVAFLTVFGGQEEDLRFQLTDGFASSLSTDRLAYATDGVLGELDNPVVLHFGPMDVEENALADVKIYPNPSEGIFNIEGQNIRKVEVFNALGQPVCSIDTENGYLKLDLTNRASGIYLIRVISDDGIQSHQIMKR